MRLKISALPVSYTRPLPAEEKVQLLQPDLLELRSALSSSVVNRGRRVLCVTLEAVACEIGDREVPVSRDSVFDDFTDCCQINTRTHDFNCSLESTVRGVDQLFIVAEVDGDRGVGNIAIYMHANIKLDEISPKR